jgi:hypothetical protein
VIQELPHRDPPTLAEQTGKLPLDAVLEGETPFTHELQDDRGDERLGRARDPEPVLRLGVTVPHGVTGCTTPDP